MKTLIIGAGEIGRSLANVLRGPHDVSLKDLEDLDGEFEVLNICYPYSKDFVKNTKEYIEKYKPQLTIINSTVKVGTTRKFGKRVVHSPILGRHPRLEEGIRTFPKYIGGVNAEDVFLASEFFRQAGLQIAQLSSPETTELAKILCTTQYGWQLMLMKEIIRVCEKHRVPFHEAYTMWNLEYNRGYSKCGEQRFIRSILWPVAGKIGGHCVVPNCDLLDDFLTNTLKERNKNY